MVQVESMSDAKCESCKSPNVEQCDDCATRVCRDCGKHQGLARCWCGWAADGGNGRQQLIEMGETIEEHEQDADCTLGADDVCTGCGVYHGDPCPHCKGRGYHVLPMSPKCEALT